MTKKGSQFERDFSRLLSLWWTYGKGDDVFWRTSQSGGRATQRGKDKKSTANSHGDIASMTPEASIFTNYFLLELKRGYSNSIGVLDILDGKKKIPTILKFWDRCELDRIRGGREENLLVIKRNAKKTIIVFQLHFYFKLRKIFGDIPITAFLIKTIKSKKFNSPSLVYMLVEDFFSWVDPIILKDQVILNDKKNIIRKDHSLS